MRQTINVSSGLTGLYIKGNTITGKNSPALDITGSGENTVVGNKLISPSSNALFLGPGTVTDLKGNSYTGHTSLNGTIMQSSN